jgi:hypothetical protein
MQNWPPRLRPSAKPAASSNRWSWNTPPSAFRV